LKREDGVSSSNGNYLHTFAEIAYRVGANDPSRVLSPEFFAGLGVQRKEIAFVAAVKEQLQEVCSPWRPDLGISASCGPNPNRG
jgi:hypothetical protein